MWLLLVTTARADAPPTAPQPQVCVERLDRTAFAERLGATEQAYLALDATAFRDGANVLAGLVVPCLGDLVPPDLSARWHRLMAVRLDALGNAEDADLAIAAARTVDPGVAFDDDWVGADHHLRAAFAASAPVETRKVPEPRSGNLAFDGTVGRERPTALPTLVQVFDASGVARATAYLSPRDPLPPYDAVPRLRNRLAASSVGAFVVGSVVIGAAYGAESRLFALSDADAGADALIAQKHRANGLSAAGYGLLGVSTGLALGAVVVGQR